MLTRFVRIQLAMFTRDFSPGSYGGGGGFCDKETKPGWYRRRSNGQYEQVWPPWDSADAAAHKRS
jgi:hypothetical protein